MSNERSEISILLAFIAIPIAAIFFIAFVLSTVTGYASCSARWSHSSYEHSFGPIKGCQVYVHGKWVPEDAVREVVTK